ncbi:hypothetical protein [Chakrabartyella piscis]|nr:hypothetical protein [Chakrabartyella piscis]
MIAFSILVVHILSFKNKK